MALPDLILGVLFRPGVTFERARSEKGASYWWILLSVISLEAVILAYSPAVRNAIPSPPTDQVVLATVTLCLEIFVTQVLCLFGVSHLLGWKIPFRDAMKFTGLVWAVALVEDLVIFYPYMQDQTLLLFWIGIPFILWRMIAQTIGIRRTSGLSLGRSGLIVLLATLPWQIPLLYLNWAAAFQ